MTNKLSVDSSLIVDLFLKRENHQHFVDMLFDLANAAFT